MRPQSTCKAKVKEREDTGDITRVDDEVYSVSVYTVAVAAGLIGLWGVASIISGIVQGSPGGFLTGMFKVVFGL